MDFLAACIKRISFAVYIEKNTADSMFMNYDVQFYLIPSWTENYAYDWKIVAVKYVLPNGTPNRSTSP
jgi:hypothetical protein